MSRGSRYRARPTRYSTRGNATVQMRPHRPRRELRPWVRALGGYIARGVRWLVGVVLKRPPAEPAPPRRADDRTAPWPATMPDLPAYRPPAAPLPRPAEQLRPAPPEPLPYRRRAHLLSKGERAVWHPLYHAVKGRYRLFCKVQLADVVSCPGRLWFNRIRGYHVDFLLCDPVTTAPLLVVELDDRSHRTEKAKKRDRYKDEVLAAAGVPILRVRAQQAYAPLELREAIDRRIRRDSPGSAQQ